MIKPLLTILVTGFTCVFQSIAADGPTPILIDTDIYGDVDDVGALAVANVLHNCGLADIKGIVINTNSRYGPLAVSAINTYFGNGDIQIASPRSFTDDIWTDRHFFTRADFASKVAMNFPRDLKDVTDTLTPAQLYAQALESVEDDSLVIVSIGFLTNLAALLDSPSNALIASKTRELVVMGGTYPGPGSEYNFCNEDPASTMHVIQGWPRSVPITYVGFEFGIDIFSGGALQDHAPVNNPIRAAYEWYVGRCSSLRQSWDPITMLYAILGIDGFRKYGPKPPFAFANQSGYNKILDSNGTNAWVNDPNVTNQHWLKPANGVTNDQIATILDQFLTHDPDDKTCFQAPTRDHEEL